jgi:predicted nucleic acid-binding protein
MSRCVIIDANRVFSELIAANHHLRRAFAAQPVTEFYCPKYVMVELFKHKERIAAATGLDEPDLLALLHTLLERIRFFDEDAISIGSWTEA